MVTPDNTLELVQKCRRHQVATTTRFSELCSGSSMFSFQAYFREMGILFPVDIRYGWDIDNACSLHIPKDVSDYCLPSFTWPDAPFRHSNSSQQGLVHILQLDRRVLRACLWYGIIGTYPKVYGKHQQHVHNIDPLLRSSRVDTLARQHNSFHGTSWEYKSSLYDPSRARVLLPHTHHRG